MDQYLEDAIDKVNKAICLMWQHFPFFKRLSEVDTRNEVQRNWIYFISNSFAAVVIEV